MSGTAVAAAGFVFAFPYWLLAIEVFLSVVALFTFGSIRWRIDKNALTYGSLFITVPTFLHIWWEGSALNARVEREGFSSLPGYLVQKFFSLRELEKLIHADTLLFILGLTYFVAVVAQTRLLEKVGSFILAKNKGRVAPTAAVLAAIVAAMSGILDGVSMIGLLIRILLVVLLLARVKERDLIFAVIVSTVVTTVCGMWLAYGEPPNLIMKANLHPHLNDVFFLRYCLPVAVGSYVVVYLNLRRRLAGYAINLSELDILDARSADIRFMQAEEQGAVYSALEFVEERGYLFGDAAQAVEAHLREGKSFGQALVESGIEHEERERIFGLYLSPSFAAHLNHYYSSPAEYKAEASAELEQELSGIEKRRKHAQTFALLAFLPFVALLIVHARNHHVPLFYSSFAGFIVALLGLLRFPKIRALALHEAFEEYKEYFFLVPLFLSISLMQKVGTFEHLTALLHAGITHLGHLQVAGVQYLFCTFLSALLDNNVVADFGSRTLLGLPPSTLKLFALAQIAGYAVGGCLTHIGSAQSVVAYALLRREINRFFTPLDWIKTALSFGIQLTVWVLIALALEHFFW